MVWVFLTADHIYGMKKPIRRQIFDFSGLDQRHHACAAELRAHRRLAPDADLGLSRLTHAQDGTLARDGDGETVDWLVRMRRLPEGAFSTRPPAPCSRGSKRAAAVWKLQ